jgi:hypothetical protein
MAPERVAVEIEQFFDGEVAEDLIVRIKQGSATGEIDQIPQLASLRIGSSGWTEPRQLGAPHRQGKGSSRFRVP